MMNLQYMDKVSEYMIARSIPTLSVLTSWLENIRVAGHLWGEPAVTVGFSHKGPVMRGFEVFFVVTMN